ncbi:MAG TPA: glycine cleavage system protein H [Hyphomicrobiaceae bacterium]|jgi:glycine cleavage system H protein|nr:glycine cleavage system protein H [Hyphomicrobiaceae bacterium]
MPVVKGCNLPDHLLYDVDNHIWFQEQDDGNVKLGMTTVATAMAGQLVAFTPKRVGRSVDAGKSCATVESGKWVGPAKSAAAGEVVKINDDLVANPKLANDDPYDKGWFIILKPADWAAVKATLTPGAQVTAKYEAKMQTDGFTGCASP